MASVAACLVCGGGGRAVVYWGQTHAPSSPCREEGDPSGEAYYEGDLE